jgi:hypothetical protein
VDGVANVVGDPIDRLIAAVRDPGEGVHVLGDDDISG